MFDLIIIGSGPGGYVAAIRAAQLGFKTALVEKDEYLGGTCLNVGCIPSKALLHSTEMFHFLNHQAKDHGIQAGKTGMDIPTLMKRKEGVVSKLRKGVQQLVAARKITILNGMGVIKKAGVVEVDGKTHETKNIIIATGSVPVELPFLKFDGKTVISSNEGIALKKTPKKMVVVGAGAIGLELGSVWARLGAEVTVVELLPKIAPAYDDDISKMAERIFKRQGLKFALNHKVTGTKKKGSKTFLTATLNDKEVEFEADKILVAVGRKPFSKGLGLEEAGVEKDKHGRVMVDKNFKTNIDGIYAIGDVIPGPMLAHKAEEDGVACVELMAGKPGHVDYSIMPNVVYTEPEIASVGLSEQEAKEKGSSVNVGKFPLAANGRAIASDATDGMIKVIACSTSDKLLGVQIIAKDASEMIASAVTHMVYGGSAEDIARTIMAHPTLSESIKEAALGVDKRAIHGM